MTQRLVVNARAAGPRLGRDVQTVIKASKSGDWRVDDDGAVTPAGHAARAGEFTAGDRSDTTAKQDGHASALPAEAPSCSTRR